MRRAALAVAVGALVYFALIALAAVAVTAGTATLDSRATAWEVVSGVVGLVAGFAAARAARLARPALALAGPAPIALAFALTTDARDTAGLWIAFAATLAGAAVGAALGRR